MAAAGGEGDGGSVCATHGASEQAKGCNTSHLQHSLYAVSAVSLTWEGGSHPVLRVLGLLVAGHDVALFRANHELCWPCLWVVLQAASGYKGSTNVRMGVMIPKMHDCGHEQHISWPITVPEFN